MTLNILPNTFNGFKYNSLTEIETTGILVGKKDYFVCFFKSTFLSLNQLNNVRKLCPLWKSKQGI